MYSFWTFKLIGIVPIKQCTNHECEVWQIFLKLNTLTVTSIIKAPSISRQDDYTDF